MRKNHSRQADARMSEIDRFFTQTGPENGPGWTSGLLRGRRTFIKQSGGDTNPKTDGMAQINRTDDNFPRHTIACADTCDAMRCTAMRADAMQCHAMRGQMAGQPGRRQTRGGCQRGATVFRGTAGYRRSRPRLLHYRRILLVAGVVVHPRRSLLGPRPLAAGTFISC